VLDLQLACDATFVLLADGRLLSWGAAGVQGSSTLLNRASPTEVPIACP
jgi:hypothetical protein